MHCDWVGSVLNSIYIKHKICPIIMMNVDGFILAEQTNEVFLSNAIRIPSGIGPTNALSMETGWTP